MVRLRSHSISIHSPQPRAHANISRSNSSVAPQRGHYGAAPWRYGTTQRRTIGHSIHVVYRDAEIPQCPRCGDALLVGPLTSVCPRDCGEWVDASSVRELDLRALGDPSTHRRIAKCCVCRADMAARTFERTEVDVCTTHGVWVDTRYRSAFAVLVAEVALAKG